MSHTDFGIGSLKSAVRDHPESVTAAKILDNFQHFINLYHVLNGKWENGWGSYMFDGNEYKWQRATLKKQEALFNIGAKSSNILEIGVYLGHSLLILLLSNPTLKITCIDNDTRFAPKAVEYLNQNFGNRVTLQIGDATHIINSMNSTEKYDMIHVDADHNNEAVLSQFTASRKLATEHAVYVFDDYEAVRGTVDMLINTNVLKKLVLPMCLWTNIVTQLI